MSLMPITASYLLALASAFDNSAREMDSIAKRALETLGETPVTLALSHIAELQHEGAREFRLALIPFLAYRKLPAD